MTCKKHGIATSIMFHIYVESSFGIGVETNVLARTRVVHTDTGFR